VGQLAGGVAHDFNNILTIIKGHADLMLSGSRLSEELASSLEKITAAADRAANLTRQMLTFSRQQIMQPRVLDLNQVINDSASGLEETLGERIALKLELANDLPPVYADAVMIEQAVMNLTVNARDAMPEGGQLTIRTSAAEIDMPHVLRNPEALVGRFACLSVADTGLGMDAQVLPRIFDPFFTTKEVGQGTGLGLATVYGAIKLHHGWIEVSSEPGKGSVFNIFLPATSK